MAIGVNYNNVRYKLKDSGKVKSWIGMVVQEEGRKEGKIDYVFSGREEMLSINREFLEHDYDTDVITFNYNEDDIVSGEVYIGYCVVKENAAEYRVSINNEILRVMVHGVLHLIGYDDKCEEEQEEMRRKEDYYLRLYYSGKF